MVGNFKAATMDRMDYGWDALRKINPKLIYCAVTGFGQDGPRAQAAAYDPTIQALSGMMAVNGTEETGPMRVGAIVIDMASAISASFAIAGALFKREWTGEGAMIDLSMQDVGASLTSPNLLQTAFGFEPALMGSRSLSGNPVADTHPRKMVSLLMPAIEAQTTKVWSVIERRKWERARFASLEARIANEAACLALLHEALGEDSSANWERRFAAAGVPAAEVLRLPDVLDDAQIAHRGTIKETISSSDGRALPYTNTPFKVTGEETGTDCPPPIVGADTNTVLTEIGYSDPDIEAYRAKGVV